MTKAELESKHLAELHEMAADAGLPRYRMMPRAELIAALAEGGEPAAAPAAKPRSRPAPTEAAAPAATAEPTAVGDAPPRRRRRRRRRPFGRRGSTQVSVRDLLLPAGPGRQVILYADSREACASLLRELAASLSGEAKGPDPVAVLIDPSPEEVADWVREAPSAEVVTAGQPHHAEDALARAVERVKGGEDVFFLIDSLTRLGEAQGDAAAAKEFFDAGREASGATGSLTVVAAVERRSSD